MLLPLPLHLLHNRLCLLLLLLNYHHLRFRLFFSIHFSFVVDIFIVYDGGTCCSSIFFFLFRGGGCCVYHLLLMFNSCLSSSLSAMVPVIIRAITSGQNCQVHGSIIITVFFTGADTIFCVCCCWCFPIVLSSSPPSPPPHCFVGVVVKASTSGAEDPGFESRLRWDFSRSSYTSDLKIGTPVATLPGAWL